MSSRGITSRQRVTLTICGVSGRSSLQLCVLLFTEVHYFLMPRLFNAAADSSYCDHYLISVLLSLQHPEMDFSKAKIG
jgi:hypothetical protein